VEVDDGTRIWILMEHVFLLKRRFIIHPPSHDHSERLPRFHNTPPTHNAVFFEIPNTSLHVSLAGGLYVWAEELYFHSHCLHWLLESVMLSDSALKSHYHATGSSRVSPIQVLTHWLADIVFAPPRSSEIFTSRPLHLAWTFSEYPQVGSIVPRPRVPVPHIIILRRSRFP